MRRKATAVLLAASAVGCAPHFAMPMTATEFASIASGPALVAYLGQRDASANVCDLRARGPHLVALDAEIGGDLASGLVDGKIEPTVWRRCADALLESASPAAARTLMDTIGRAYRTLLKDSDLEKSPALQGRLSAMHLLYLERKNDVFLHLDVAHELFADLRSALTDHRLGPVATRFGADLLESVDIEHGQIHGRPIDLTVIDQLYAAHDEGTLNRVVARIADVRLRDEAKRRVIRMHIATSAFPEVSGHPADVEEVVMTKGAYPLSLVAFPPVSGSVDMQSVPMRGVLVRQDLWQQTAKLLGYENGPTRNGPSTISVLPEVSLRGALKVVLSGISRPVTLCAPPQSLDPTPCIAASDVTFGAPTSYLDRDGAFHFVDHITMLRAVEMTQMRDTFVLPVNVGGQPLITIAWRLSYERPQSLVFEGGAVNGNGPRVGVTVDARDPTRFIFTVSDARARYLAVVERADAEAFRVVSRGASGAAGASGSTGSSGSSGSECSSGGSGGNGGDGSPGGDGSDGGDLHFQIACGDSVCSDALSVLRRTIVSEGGAGGAGGSGGAGGAGGAGGSGRSASTHTDSNGNTVVDDPGCSAGSSGSSGASGSNGASGSPGRAGHVYFDGVR